MGTQRNKVTEIRLTAEAARSHLREIAEDSSRVIPMPHAKQRMRQRKITMTQLLRCIKHGIITEGPSKNIHGNWQMTIETVTAGERISAAVVLDRNERGEYVAIITVF